METKRLFSLHVLGYNSHKLTSNVLLRLITSTSPSVGDPWVFDTKIRICDYATFKAVDELIRHRAFGPFGPSRFAVCSITDHYDGSAHTWTWLCEKVRKTDLFA